MQRRRLTQIFPILLPLRVKQRIFFYKINMKFDKHVYSKCIDTMVLPKRIFKHKSILIREFNNVNIHLQKNKITNLKIAASKISGIIIKPQEVFSFWNSVGNLSYSKGYKDGVFLSDGAIKIACGGGLCQLSNLLFWMFLHTPLQVIERYRHSVDPFPDCGRVIPFGTGATLVQGWKDLKIKNTTHLIWQINIWFDETYIYGEVRANDYPEYSYHIEEKNHHFTKKKDGIYRKNQIYRKVIDRRTGNLLLIQHLFDNDSLIKYNIDDNLVNSTFDNS